MKTLKKIAAALALPCALLGTAQPAMAAFPDKPLKIVVPYSTGGSSDNLGRVVADVLSKELGQPVIVENKPGAGSMIGTDYVAEQPADGYTLLLADVPFTIVPSLYKDRIKYDAKKDFSPLGLIGQSPMYLFVNKSFKARTPQELAAMAKQAPRTITIGSGGNGSFTHLMAELFMQKSGTALVHVPYKSAAASMTDLAGGQIDASFSTMPSAAAIYQAGKVVPIGVSSPERNPDTPDVPTFKERGFDSMTIQSWWGLMAPSETPDAIRAKLSDALMKALKDEGLQKRLRSLGVTVPEKTDPETMSRFLREDFQRWEDVISSANITLN